MAPPVHRCSALHGATAFRFHQVQPGGAGGREVDMEAGPFGEPVPDQRRLVGGVVVRNQVHVQPAGTSDSMASRNLRNSTARWRRWHWPITLPVLASKAAKRGWCRGARNHGCAAPPGPGAGATAAWCGPDLGLLVHAQDQRPVRWIKVEAHNVPHLFDEEGVRRQLEGVATVAVRIRSYATSGRAAPTKDAAPPAVKAGFTLKPSL